MSCLALRGDPSSTTDAPAPAGELALSTPIRCERLRAVVPARCCILRQLAADRGRTRQLSRGQATRFPSCDCCAQGRAVRASTVGADGLRWGGHGTGGRYDRGTDGAERWAGQLAARERLRLVGALEIPPCLDEPPEEPDKGPPPLP